MDRPKLYGEYDRTEAIDLFDPPEVASLFGPLPDTRSLCDGQWVIFRDVALGFVELGEPPRLSHFTNAGVFCWVADKPYRVGDDRLVDSVPREVVGGHAESPAIHLFVRKGGSGRYLYVGRLAPACRFSRSDKDNHGAAYFDLSPALPSEVWIGLGGFRPGDLDHAAVDDALSGLHHPTNVEDRLGVLRRLVEYWHGPIGPEDGFGQQKLEGLAIPDPLRWWYGWAGRRERIMSGQNDLLDSDKLRIKDGKLLFYAENQGCYLWGTEPEGHDPPVFGLSEDDDPWEPEGITLSEHLILACLFEAVMCHAPYGASASWLEEPVLGRLVDQIPPIAIGPWRWCDSMRFYAKDGAFMIAAPNGEIDGRRGYSVWIGAKTEHPLRSLKPFINERWEHVAV